MLICMDVSYILLQLNDKNSSSMFFNELHVKSLKFNKTIHQEWSFGFLKSKFGICDQNCLRSECKLWKTKNVNHMIIAIFF